MSATGKTKPRKPKNSREGGAGTDTPEDTSSPRLITKKAAAAYVGVSVPTFTKWVAAGLFPPSVSITKKWDKKAIDAQLDEMSGLESHDDDGGYERRKRERDAKKAARSR